MDDRKPANNYPACKWLTSFLKSENAKRYIYLYHETKAKCKDMHIHAGVEI